MARQTYYVTRDQKHPLYRTRMLQAGPIELDASAARLYRKHGVDLSDEAPKSATSFGKEEFKPVQPQAQRAPAAPKKPAAKRTPRKRKSTAKK